MEGELGEVSVPVGPNSQVLDVYADLEELCRFLGFSELNAKRLDTKS